MALKLLREEISPDDLSVMVEDGAEKSFKIKGIFIQSEILNRNNRIYPESLCEREVNRYISQEISRKNSLGEYQHPQSAIVNRERAAILIESLVKDGKNYIGTAKVLKEFPMGKLVYSMLKEGIPTGISTRGLGTVNESNRRVNSDFRLLCADVVDTPSAPDAWVQGILENKEFIIDGNLITEIVINDFKRKLDKNGSRDLVKNLKEFLNSL